MPRLQVSTRMRVIVLSRLGYSLRDIQHRLSEEGTTVTLRSLQRLCDKFQRKHTIQDLPRTKPRLLTTEMLPTMENCLRNDDELTARKLKEKLSENFEGFPEVSISTIKQNHRERGWVCTCPHYCQLIREANKAKRNGVRSSWITMNSLLMLYLQMNVLSSWTITGGYVFARKRNSEC